VLSSPRLRSCRFCLLQASRPFAVPTELGSTKARHEPATGATTSLTRLRLRPTLSTRLVGPRRSLVSAFAFRACRRCPQPRAVGKAGAARAKRIKSLFVDRIDGESSITGWNRHVSPGLSIKCTSPCAGGLRIHGRPTREARIPACSCRSPATTPPISKCRTRNSKCWPNATGGSCASISVRAAGLTSLNDAVRQAFA
jgi:hypothetical protein